MHRTKARPLPSGRITPQGALCVAAGSGMAGTALLLAGTNPVVAALGLGNIVLYGCVNDTRESVGAGSLWGP